MFNFLKDKLKSAISKISKKVEEESPEEIEEVKTSKKEETKKDKPEKTKELKKDKKKSKSQDHKNKPEEEIIEQEISKPKIEGVKIVYFVHGTTLDNENGISTGQADGELSELGKKQAIELKDKINVKDFDVVFTSDLKRAVDSAKLTWKDSKIKIIEDKRLRECDYGDLNQASEDNVDYSKHIHKKFPSGESLKEVEKRIALFLNEILIKYNGKNIAIIAHKAPQLALEVLLNEKTWEQAIKQDWRLKKAWQPGWNFLLIKEVEVPIIEDIVVEEKKGFFSKLKDKFSGKKQEEKPIEEIKVEEPIIEEKQEEKKGFFSSIKEKIINTKISEDKFNEIFYELELALLENNVAFEVVEKIKEDMKKNIVDKPIKRGQVEEEVKNSLKLSIQDLFNIESFNILERVKTKKPYVICFVGINGSGKTTTIGKFAYLLQKK